LIIFIKFFHHFHHFNIFKEKFFFLKDSFLLYKDYEKIGLRCHLCNIQTHTIFDCPSVHNQFDSDLIIKRHLYSISQSRKRFFKRKSFKSNNTLSTKKYVENCALNIRLKALNKPKRRIKIEESSQNLSNFSNSEVSLSQISDNHDKNDESSDENQTETKEINNNLVPLNINPKENPSFFRERERVASLFSKPKKVSIGTPELCEEKKNSNFDFFPPKKNSIFLSNFNKKEAQLFWMEFDRLKNYSHYFSHNNISNILKQNWYKVGILGLKRSITKHQSGLKFWRQKKTGSKRKKESEQIEKK